MRDAARTMVRAGSEIQRRVAHDGQRFEVDELPLVARPAIRDLAPEHAAHLRQLAGRRDAVQARSSCVR